MNAATKIVVAWDMFKKGWQRADRRRRVRRVLVDRRREYLDFAERVIASIYAFTTGVDSERRAWIRISEKYYWLSVASGR
jgi:hypothetical protein